MKRSEKAARLLVFLMLAGMLVAIAAARWGSAPWQSADSAIEIHAALPEDGGWTPGNLKAQVGVPLHLRLVSDDVVHGFAIGQMDWPAVDLLPGKVVEKTLVFNRPGKYTYYCTRWCGLNHWRMRGVIEVSGAAADGQAARTPLQPLYLALGLDIDAEHHAHALPEGKPSAERGAALAGLLPQSYRSLAYYQSHSPEEAFLALRVEPPLQALGDQEIWDLVAYLWSSQAAPEALQAGGGLYAANCAACHGERGAGDGVMASALEGESAGHDVGAISGAVSGHTTTAPTDFTLAEHMLGASPAVLHGKIVRGGMGTGMPYWGPIFTEEQVWALVAYLWSFQFNFGG